MTMLVLGLSLILGFFGPDAWLTRKIDERRSTMLRALPDVLDLLVISVEAGLGFDSALSRVVATVPGPLSEEFFRMLQETRVGVTRRDAMRHLMERTDLDELRSFILSMMQAEAFGVTISRVLRVQADEIDRGDGHDDVVVLRIEQGSDREDGGTAADSGPGPDQERGGAVQSEPVSEENGCPERNRDHGHHDHELDQREAALAAAKARDGHGD